MKDLFTPLQVEALAQTFDAVFDEIDKRIAEALAAQPPAVHHRGTWKPGAFKGGSLCTDKGSLWLARRDTAMRPGVDESWQLIVKNGHANGHAGLRTVRLPDHSDPTPERLPPRTGRISQEPRRVPGANCCGMTRAIVGR